MFFLNLISVVGKKSPKIARILVVLMAVGMLLIFTACEKDEVYESGSKIHVERTFPRDGSTAPHMDRPFAFIALNRKIAVDSLRKEVSFLVTDEKGNLQSYGVDFGDEKTTSELRILFNTFIPKTKYYITLRSTNLYYRFGFTIR